VRHRSFFLNYFICFYWRLVTLQYCSGFCHTLTWISCGCTCVPHPETPSQLPPHLSSFIKEIFVNVIYYWSVIPTQKSAQTPNVHPDDFSQRQYHQGARPQMKEGNLIRTLNSDPTPRSVPVLPPKLSIVLIHITRYYCFSVLEL